MGSGAAAQGITGRRAWFLAGAVLVLLVLAGGLLHFFRDRPPPLQRDDVHFPPGEVAYFAGDYEAAIASFKQSIEVAPRDPRPYYRLVDACFRQGDLPAAEVFLRSLLAADPENARAHYGLGCLALKRQDLPAARAEAERAAGLDRHFGHARLLLGSAHNLAGRPEQALRAWRQARKIFRAAGARLDESWALNRMGLVLRQKGEFRQALREFTGALALQRAEGDRPAQLIVLGNLALTQADLGDLERSLAALEEALAIAREIGDRENECWILNNLAYLDILAGQFESAIACSDTAIAIAREIGDPLEEVSGLENCATAYLDLGNPVRAVEICQEALPIAESIVDPRHRAGVLLVLAEAYGELGRSESARSAYARCDSIYGEIGLAAGSVSALVGLCQVAVQEGDTTYALVEGERALETFAEDGYAEGEEFVALMLCDLVLRRGDPQRAVALATRAVKLSSRDGRRSREALARARRVGARLALDDIAGAAADAREGRRLARLVRNPEVFWRCEMAAGDVKRPVDPAGALQHYQAAMEAVESVRRELRLEEFQAAYLADRLELYFKAADLLAQLGRPAEALMVCERSRARALTDFLAASPVPVLPQVPAALAAESRELEARIQTLQATLAAVAAGPDADPRRLDALEDQIAVARTRGQDLRTRILLQDPRYGAVMPAGTLPGPERILASLRPGEALLEFFLGPRTSLCLVATADRINVVRLEVGIAALASRIHRLREPLLAPRSLATLSFDVSLARWLRERILDPVAPFLAGVNRLFVVPDGPLNYLPLEALPVSSPAAGATDTLFASFGGTRFVGDRYAVSYLPSASFLVLAAGGQEPETEPTARRSLLALGDPAGPETPVAGTAAVAGAGSGDRLLYADREVRAIARLFPDAVVRSGAEASEVCFKALAPSFRFLHVSSHGKLDERVPLYSGLALYPGPSGREDGFLHAYEVLSLRLNCDLVTLSACQTGLGRLYAGEGLLGLTRSFLYAGAQQALVSLWSVNDASTAILMESFYANLAAGLDAPRALQQAKSALRAVVVSGPGGRPLAYAHPFFWAPFVLIGLPYR